MTKHSYQVCEQNITTGITLVRGRVDWLAVMLADDRLELWWECDESVKV